MADSIHDKKNQHDQNDHHYRYNNRNQDKYFNGKVFRQKEYSHVVSHRH
jgi:hypothetical protein